MPGDGFTKHQFSLQVCYRPVGIQPPLATVFGGKRKRICDDEKKAWHPFEHVLFSEKCLGCQWMEKTIKPFIEEENVGRYTSFCDNLTVQTSVQSSKFKVAVSDWQVLCSMGCTMPQTYGLPNYMIPPLSILVHANHLLNTFEITDIDSHKFFLHY